MKSNKVSKIILKDEKNPPLPIHRNIKEYIKFWTSNSSETKGGSFNLKLYLDYLSHLDKNGNV